MPVLLITRSPSVHESVVPLCAAAGIAAEVCADPGLSLATWREADLVLVGSDLAGLVVALAPPRRPGVHLVGAPPDDAAFRHAVTLGADSVVELPEGAPWLSDALADVGERGSPGRLVGVVGGTGGAGATTLACALAQWHARLAPTLLVDGDPLGPGVDRLLGMEDVPGVRWEALAETSGRLGAGALRESCSTSLARAAPTSWSWPTGATTSWWSRLPRCPAWRPPPAWSPTSAEPDARGWWCAPAASATQTPSA
jgi:secretion/DNA translocation related CpaE-like protein